MTVRLAKADDAALIFSFIKKKSEFDRDIGAYSGKIQTTEDRIARTLFGHIPFAYALLVEQEQQTVGFALYGFRYSSFVGQPSIWLDDLYINEDSRRKGMGWALMSHLQKIGQNNNCSHMAWTADARNVTAIDFYSRLGAEIFERKENRCFFKWVMGDRNIEKYENARSIE